MPPNARHILSKNGLEAVQALAEVYIIEVGGRYWASIRNWPMHQRLAEQIGRHAVTMALASGKKGRLWPF
jgi:hypothetical protein